MKERDRGKNGETPYPTHAPHYALIEDKEKNGKQQKKRQTGSGAPNSATLNHSHLLPPTWIIWLAYSATPQTLGNGKIYEEKLVEKVC